MSVIKTSAPLQGRILQLDTVRGIAILGIFLMNIFGFALPQTAYMNPYYMVETPPSEASVWIIFNLFFQGKFLGIFSLLFGATLALLQYRSLQWNHIRLYLLAVLGLIHGIGFWSGDILLAYALTGLITAYLLAHYDERVLLKIAITIYLASLALLYFLGLGIDPTYFWQITADGAALEASQKVSGGMVSLQYRLSEIITMVEMLFIQYGWQLVGLMIAGALLLKNGWLRGEFTESHYRKMALWLILPALIVQMVSLYGQSLLGWGYFVTSIVGYIVNELMIPFQALGYIALVYGFWSKIQSSLLIRLVQNVGKMALSNYLLQTLICTTIFYHLGYYEKFTRLELLAFILPVWGCNLLFSYVYLKFFTQGPIEWCWRRMTEKLS